MALGHIYKVTDEMEDACHFDENEVSNDIGNSWRCDFATRTGKTGQDLKDLAGILSQYDGITVNTEEDANGTYLKITAGPKFQKNYFLEPFNELKKLMENMTIDEFAVGTKGVNRIERLARKQSNDMVHCEPYGYIDFNEFIRLMEPEKTYFINDTLLLK